MACPGCGAGLLLSTRSAVEMNYCPVCRGVVGPRRARQNH
ncbi:zf-TFIIB domain-containing protein [Agrobacterium tumefaciens]